MTLWDDAGRLALLTIQWACLVAARGPGCARSWWLAVEGPGLLAAAWCVGDVIAAQRLKGRMGLAPWGRARSLARISFAVAAGLVLGWGVAGLALCWARA